MKVTVFTTSLSGTGVGRVVLALVEGLAERGVDLDLVVMTGVNAYPEATPKNLQIVDLKVPRLWTSLPSFLRYLSGARPGVVFAHGDLSILFSVIAKLFSRLPTRVYAVQHGAGGFVFENKNALRHKLLKHLVRRSLRYADGVIAVSRGVAELIASESLASQDRIKVIYNGIDIANVERLSRENVTSFFPDGDVPLVLGVGTLSLQKNFTLLIRAFAIVRKTINCRLLILGDGSERLKLERLCRELDVSDAVAMPGFVSNPFAYIAKASVFVLSSIHEGLPTVLIEAIACSTPVVSTDCPYGPKEILDDGRYGTLVPMNDIEALAAAILYTLQHPLPTEAMKARAQFFSIEAYVEGYLNLVVSKASETALE